MLIKKVSKTLPQNNSETVENEVENIGRDSEMPRERYISPNTGTATALNNTDRKETFRNGAPFTNCMSVINHLQVDDAHDIDVIMAVHNLAYSDIYFKTWGILWQYYRN